MKVNGVAYRTIWVDSTDGWTVEIIDQTKLPHEFVVARLTTMAEAAHAIRSMQVRGAPLVGATAAYGMCLAMREDPSDANLTRAYDFLMATRPTAVNLRWALDLLRDRLRNCRIEDRAAAAHTCAAEICDDDVATCASIGDNGLKLIEKAWEKKGREGQGQCPDALQCRLAGDRRLGDRALAHLQGV